MKIVFIQSVCTLLIINEINSVSSALTRKKYNVDDFVNKLLASSKFEELVEKVANKAAEKISNIYIKNESTYVENYTPEFRFLPNVNENATVTEVTNEPEKVSQEIKDIVYMKTNAMMPLKELRLKYKQFTKTTAAEQKSRTFLIDIANYENKVIESDKETSKSQEETTTRSPEIDEEDISASMPYFHGKEEKLDVTNNNEVLSKEMRSNILSVNPEYHVHNDSETVDINTLFKTNSTQKDYENDDKSDLEESNLKISSQSPITKKNIVISSSTEEINETIEIMIPDKQLEPTGESTKSVKKNGNYYSDLIEDNEDSDSKSTETNEKLEKFTPAIQNVIRQEGDKFYTYQKGSGYEEYFEELAKTKKTELPF